MPRRPWLKSFGLIAFFLLAAAPLPQAAQDHAALKQQIIERIEAEVAEKNIVGLSAGFAVPDRPIGTMHFGWQDREAEIPASDDTMYRWASISKPVTAVVVMQLVNEGELDLDRNVRDYVPEFSEKPWPITARQLLCHQGGIVHYTNGTVIETKRDYDVEHPFQDVVVALDNFHESPLVAEPGTMYSYTTRGYILLSAVAQRAGGAPFATLVHEGVVRPLKMETMRPDYQWEDIPNRAVGYREGFPGTKVRSGNSDVSWKLGGGGFISNVADLTRFGVGMVELKLVDRDTRDRMWTAQSTADGTVTSYGLGFGVSQVDGHMVAAHSGSQQKTATYLIMDPEAGIVIALMCNTEGTRLHTLGADLMRLLRTAVQP